MTIDRFAEKYTSMNPYQYGANNPIKFIDVNGDSIDLAMVQMIDKALGTTLANDLVTQLSDISGLNLSINAKGKLIYQVDASGNAIVAQKGGNNVGSATARNDLMSFIKDRQTTINVTQRPNGRTVTVNNGNQIGLDPKQIQGFVNGTPSVLNSNTLGVGMVFLHELQHTSLGGGHRDPPRTNLTATGPVVTRVNTYRTELDSNPINTGAAPYGQRRHYNAIASSTGSSASVRFSYSRQTRRGRNVTRYTRITF